MLIPEVLDGPLPADPQSRQHGDPRSAEPRCPLAGVYDPALPARAGHGTAGTGQGGAWLISGPVTDEGWLLMSPSSDCQVVHEALMAAERGEYQEIVDYVEAVALRRLLSERGHD